MIVDSQCLRCKHFIDDTKFNCMAFPDGIPDEILYNKFDHTKPFKGDNGIQFEPLE